MAKLWTVGGYVYVIGTDAGPYKVGWSGNPTNRLADIQTSNHVKVHLQRMAWFTSADEAMKVEAMAHKLLADRSIRGEWFDVDLDVATVMLLRAAQTVLGHDLARSRLFVRKAARPKRQPPAPRTVRPEPVRPKSDDSVRTCSLPPIVCFELECDCGRHASVRLPRERLSAVLRCSSCGAVPAPF